MGLLWELFQEYQIGKRKDDANTLEDRVSELENEVLFLESLLEQIIPIVEDISGKSVEQITPGQ